MKPNISMEDVYELSPLQAGMLFDSVYGAERPMYMVQLQLAISGEVNMACLSEAWQRTVQRHPILRTSFHWRGLGKPAQVVHSTRKAAIETHDLSALCQDSQAVEIQRFCDADRARGFDLSRAPLARLSLLHLGQGTWRLVWTFHHLIMDGWSWSPVLQELFFCYDALRSGQEPSLLEVVPYRDYIRWLREQDHDAAEMFWKKSLQGAASPVRLNEDLVPSSERLIPQFGERWITYDKEAVLRWSRKSRVTLSTLAMGAWAVLLGRLSESNDILFGNVVSGRPADLAGIESIIGPTINTVPTRIRVDQTQTVLEWLRDLQKSQAAARCFDYSQISDIRRWAQMPVEQPLFHTTFVFENYPMSLTPGTTIAGLKISPLPMTETPNQSFMVEAEVSRELAVHFVYDSGRFSEAAVSQIAAQYRRLLHQMVTSPEARLAELDLMDESEREQVLVEWNSTQEEFPDLACIHELFETQALLSPERVAVIFENESLSYGELNRRANRLAHYLSSLGVGAETLVGVCMERRPEMIVGLLAILKSGGAYVPLDPNSPHERRSLVVRTARLQLILSDRKFSQEFEGEETRIVSLDLAEAEIQQSSDQNPPLISVPENLAYVMFTSGSTGVPKGVQIAHRNVINCLHSFRKRLVARAEDTVVALTSLSFDIAALEMFLPLLIGARVLLTGGAAAGAKELARQLNGPEEMIVQATPSTFRLLLQAGWQGGGPLKLLCGGEALDPQLAHELAMRGDALWNVYGPTETTIWSTCHPITVNEEHVSLGRPIGNTQLFVLDGELLPVPVGMRGELFIAGAGLARGYLNRPDLTAERFLSNPFSAEAGARMYRTGDLVRYEKDGNLEFLGRADYQVKIRGHRIELEEIEAVLRLQHGVQDGAVVVREDAAGEKKLVAFVVWKGEETFAESELRAQLKKSFPEYMVPTTIVRLEQMPLTPNGKVDRKSLPATELVRAASVYRGPRTPEECALACIWEEVLGRKRIGIDDNFFDLGGHSLLAMKVISRVWEVFHRELPLRLLFANPTIAGFATLLQPGNSPSSSHAENQTQENSAPQPAKLSFAQERMWFMEQLEPGSALYNIPIALRLRGKLHAEAVEKALQQIVNRHEALRTAFVAEHGAARPVIEKAVTLALPLLDISQMETQGREQQAEAILIEEAQRPFDLRRPPLLRAQLLRLGSEDHILQITLHHSVTDGWSMGVLLQEFAELYRVELEGRAERLPNLAWQYRDYAAWQRRHVQGELLEGQMAYWRKQLAEAPAALELPTDRPRPAIRNYRGEHYPFLIDSATLQALKLLTRNEGATLFMGLLAGYTALLHRYTGQADIVVGTPVAGRSREETESLIGLFVNTLALRTDLSGNHGFGELLRQVRETTLDAYENQDVPFEKLVEEFAPARNSGQSLFQVMFALEERERTIELPALRQEWVNLGTKTAKFDLTLLAQESPDGLKCIIEYSTELFDAQTIVRMAGHLQRLLQHATTEPERSISELALLSEAERHEITELWNATQADYPRHASVHELFEQQAARTPEAAAVIYGNQQLNYRELNQRANQLAHYLRKQGVTEESRIGICLERSTEMVVAMLATLKAGGAYVPLDPHYPPERLEFMLQDVAAELVLTEESLEPWLNSYNTRVVCLDRAKHEIESCDRSNPESITKSENLAYIIYTSGSTGRPKGIGIPHQAINRLICNTDYIDFRPSDRIAQASNSSFDALTFELWGALLQGACLVGVSKETALSPSDLARMVEEEGINVMFLTTALFNQISRESVGLFASLRCLLFGGEAVDPGCVANVLAAQPPERFTHVYGPTETTTFATWHLIRELKPGSGTVPIGRGIRNTQLYVLDEQMEAAPAGVIGELYIGGDGLARGYWNRPELTAEKFVPDAFNQSAGSRLYRTGDRVRWLPQGELEFVGRGDHQVKIRGFRIELGELEAALRGHPEVNEAIALVREDIPGDKRLVAYITAKSNDTEELSKKLRSYLKDKLPEYMRPSALLILSQLPLTPNGKLDRACLPKPEHKDYVSAEAQVAPRNALELQVLEVWRQILGTEELGVTDHFFEVGGHSLAAVRLIAEIQNRFGIKLPVATLFDGKSDTIEAMSMLLKDKELPAIAPLVSLTADNGNPPLFCVHPGNGEVTWFLNLARHLGGDHPVYALQDPAVFKLGNFQNNIKDMAAAYIAEIRKARQHGPYHLAGYSFGGLVAYEMAQQLTHSGDEVGTLILLDAASPRFMRDLHQDENEIDLEEIVQREMALLTKPASPDATNENNSDAEARKGFEHAQLMRSMEIFRARLQAGMQYLSQQYPGKIILFRSSEIDPHLREDLQRKMRTLQEADLTLGWETLCMQPVETHTVPGNHVTMGWEPQVGLLAQGIIRALRESTVNVLEESDAVAMA